METKHVEIVLVTGNQEKVRIARAALEPFGVSVVQKKIDCPEIQADDNLEIALYSARFARDVLQASVVKLDSGLYIEALSGFPGPYSAYVEHRLDAQDILALMKGRPNRSAYYKEVLAYCPRLGEAIAFETLTPGTIAHRPSGDHGQNFDRIFIRSGADLPMAHLRRRDQGHDVQPRQLEPALGLSTHPRPGFRVEPADRRSQVTHHQPGREPGAGPTRSAARQEPPPPPASQGDPVLG